MMVVFISENRNSFNQLWQLLAAPSIPNVICYFTYCWIAKSSHVNNELYTLVLIMITEIKIGLEPDSVEQNNLRAG